MLHVSHVLYYIFCRDDTTPFKRYKIGHEAADALTSNWTSYSNVDVVAEGATAYMGSPLRSPAPTSSASSAAVNSSAQRLFGSFANGASSFLNNVLTGSPAPAPSTAMRFGSQSQSSQSQSQSQVHSYPAAAAPSPAAPSPAVKHEFVATQQGHSQSSYGSIGGSESSAYRASNGAAVQGSYAASTPNGAQPNGRGFGSHARDAESAQESKGTPEMVIDLT